MPVSDSAQHVDLPVLAVARRKLIEVSIPLQKINEESARESRSGTVTRRRCTCGGPADPRSSPSQFFAQLVDDPASRPDLYPTIEDQELERKGCSNSWNDWSSGRTPTTRLCCVKRTPEDPGLDWTATRRPFSTPSPAVAPSRWRRSASAWRPTPPTSIRSRCSSTRH